MSADPAPSIAVLGAGAFGTALAIALARAGARVALWARDPAQAEAMARTRQSPRLPGAPLPENVSPTADIAATRGAEATLLAVPTQRLAALLGAQAPAGPLVACCKGIDLSRGLGPLGLIDAAGIPGSGPGTPAALLTGPSFAADIARGLPTALTLACTSASLGARLQALLSTPALRLYTTTDTIGAELGGALKNVVAIGCGAAIGAGLGESARAALMTRGYAETVRLATALGARPETLAGLSGLGDMVLTCTSEASRNYRLGLALGRGEPFDPAVTVEGAATAPAALALAARHGVELPVAAAVDDIAAGRIGVAEAMARLLARPPREE